MRTRTGDPNMESHSAKRGNVSNFWVTGDGVDGVVVCVCDRRQGAYFEIPTEPHLALDVFYHPFAYRDFSTVDYEDSRLAA